MRGCLEDTTKLLHSLGIQTRIVDERFVGDRVKAEFTGTLRPEQLAAADALLEHDTGVLAASTAFGKTVVAAIHEIYKALLQSDERNQGIVADVMNAIKNNRFPVILTERKEHLETLKSLLENKIQNLIVMKGGMGKKQRKAALNALESLPDLAEKALLATGRYLGEGFDDKRLDTLFLTLPISWRGTLSQYAGRLHRIHDSKKEVVIYDYVDFEVPVLARMYDRRIKGYRSIGYEIEDDQS